MQQLKWASSKQDKEIHSLRSKLRESMVNQSRLEQEVKRLKDKLERVEHLSRSRNEKDAQSRLYEDVLKRITELSQRQNQMHYDLTTMKEHSPHTCSSGGSSTTDNHGYMPRNPLHQSVIQRLSPNLSHHQELQEFDYELAFSASNIQLVKNYSSTTSSPSNMYLNDSHQYTDMSPVLQLSQQQSKECATLEDATNLFYDQAALPKKQEDTRNSFEPFFNPGFPFGEI